MRSDWEAGNAKHDPADPMGTEDGKTWVEAGRQPNRGDTSGAAGGPSLAWPSVGCHRFWRFIMIPDTWHGGPWYWNFQWFGEALIDQISWAGAQQACLHEDLLLATVHSSYDNAEIQAVLAAAGAGSSWIGASDQDYEGTWTWSDGTSFDFNGWAPGEPNGGTGESCAEFYTNGLWNDANCGNDRPVVCMARPVTPHVDSTYPSFSVTTAADISVQDFNAQWYPIPTFKADGYKGLIHGFEFDLARGRFTAHYEGTYVAAGHVRLDFADSGWYALAILTNDEPSWNSGCSVLSGHNPPPERRAADGSGRSDPEDPFGFANNHLSVSCLVRLEVGDYSNLNVYGNSDRSYVISKEGCGFSMARLDTHVAFSGSHHSSHHLINSTHFQEVSHPTAFSTNRYPTLFSYRTFDGTQGRFTAPLAGTYLVSGTARLDHADDGYFGLYILTNGRQSRANDNGLTVLLGDPAHNYEAATVAGMRLLAIGDYLSLYVYAQRDRDWTINGNNGGFAAALIETDGVAMSAASICHGSGHNRHITEPGWTELSQCDDGAPGWTVEGYPGLFAHANFDPSHGRFTATDSGMYFASASVRINGATEGIFGFGILTNGERNFMGGVTAMNAALASNYDSFCTVGVRALEVGDFLSAWVYSSTDHDFAAGTDRSGFHVAMLSRELPSMSGSDVDVEADGLMWQEVWGHPQGHDSSDAGWNHFEEAASWGTCGASREERIQCCADECILLGPDVCVAFAIHARTRDAPPTVCHYIGPEDMPGSCMNDFSCIIGGENFGNGWGTWIPDIPHGWDAVTALTADAETCDWDTFFDRSDEVNNVCCATDGMCTDGMPNECALTCAQVFVPFMDECREILLELMNNDISDFIAIDDDCNANAAEDIWTRLAELQNDGCTWGDLSAAPPLIGSNQRTAPPPPRSPPPPPPRTPGGGHRRNQGLNFHRQFDTEECPARDFDDRVTRVDSICCMQNGVDVCPPGGVPTQCTIECGIVYRSFFTECNVLLHSIMDDEYPAFEALHEACDAHDSHQLIYAMDHAICTVPAASCAEYDALAPLEQSGITGLRSMDGIAFETHCMAAADLGTTGHPFTRFWHYTGGAGAVFPPHVNDVLGDRYGMCTDPDACFGRLPEWLEEDGTQMLVTDGTTTLQFEFDSSHDLAHTAWQAFHDHATGRCNGCTNWQAVLLQGEWNSVQEANTDCFAYDESWGVKSFLLDDDMCYCNSALEAGKIMCGANGENEWGDSPQGADLSPGVDFVAPSEGCEYVSPEKGPLSLYFREAFPPSFRTCAEIKAQNRRAQSGIYTIDLDGPGGSDKNTFEAYCDMETDGGGWTLAMHQSPNECLSESTSKIGDGAEWYNSGRRGSFRWGSKELSTVRPGVAWVLSDAQNRVFFRPACVVDFEANALRDQNIEECEAGFTDATFESPVSDHSDNNGSQGIGMNNSGNFCSIRAYLDQTMQSLNQGCACPCDPAATAGWSRPPGEQVQLWFK